MLLQGKEHKEESVTGGWLRVWNWVVCVCLCVLVGGVCVCVCGGGAVLYTVLVV